MVLLHLPKHSPHMTWSSPGVGLPPPFLSLLGTTSTPRPPVNYSEQASFSSHENPLPLLKDGARPTFGRPPSPRAAAAIPHPEYQRMAMVSAEAPPLTKG